LGLEVEEYPKNRGFERDLVVAIFTVYRMPVVSAVTQRGNMEVKGRV
jgi:hypothetical protein